MLRAPLLRIVVAGLAAAAVSGCRACPEAPDLETPESTIDTFARAFSCDEPDIEYRCLADSLKTAFGGFSAYAVGREVFRREHPVAVFALRWKDVSDLLTVERLPDGRRAIVRVALDDGAELEVRMVNEPFYRVTGEDGSTIEGFAADVRAEFAPAGRLFVLLEDPRMEAPGSRPVAVEIETRWVIESLPGIGDALAAAHSTSP